MSNLLKKASIVLTPTAYNDGEVLCVKPEDGSGDFDFSRNSAATRVNAQGLVENVQILSSNLVQNGDFSELGTEEVSNGSFSQEGVEIADDSTITNAGGSIMTKVSALNYNATSDGTGSSSIRPRLFFNDVTTGNFYRIRVSGTNQSGSVNFKLYDGNAYIVEDNDLTTDVDLYFEAKGASVFIAFDGTNPFNVDFTISLKEVGQDWTFGTGWSVGEDKAVCDGSQSATSYLEQTLTASLSQNKIYKITYTATIPNGNLRPELTGNGGTSVGTSQTTSGTYTDYIKAEYNHIKFRFRGNADFNGSVTNISVKEVDPNDYWTLGTGWSIGDGVAISDATQGYINQNNLGGAGVTATYKVQWTQNITAGTRLRFFARNYNDGGNATIISITRDDGLVIGGGNCIGNGTFTAYVSSTNGYSFKLLAEAGVEADISNVTTIQITDDTNLPRINYEGFSYQDALGSEQVVNGNYNESGIGNVISQSGGILVNENNQLKITSNGSSGFSRGVWNTNGLEGQQFLIKADIISVSGSTRFIDISNNQGQSLTQGTTFSTIITLGSATKQVGFGGLSDTSFELVIDNVSVKEYLGQEVVPDSGCGSWLFEPQSTNTIDRSNFYGAAGYHSGLTRTSDAAISPDGTFNAMSFIPTATAGVHRSGYSTTAGSYAQNDIVTFSGFVKANGYDFVAMGGFFGNEKAVFNISNGTLVSQESNVVNTEIVKLTNDWYRLSTTYTFQNTIGNAFLYTGIQVMETATGYSFIGDGVSGVYCYGFQAELGTGTSYIPTEGSQTTRNQDVCINGGSLASINSTEGVLYAEIAKQSEEEFKLISLNNAANNEDNNSVTIGFNNSENSKLYLRVKANDNNVLLSQNILSNKNQFYKIAIKYKSGEVSFFVDGVKVLSSTSSFSFSAQLDNLSFDFNGDGTLPFYGKTKALVVYKEALSDEELTELTTI